MARFDDRRRPAHVAAVPKVLPRPTVRLARGTVIVGCLLMLAGCGARWSQPVTEPVVEVPPPAFDGPVPAADAWHASDIIRTDCPVGTRILEEVFTENAPGDVYDITVFVIDGPMPCYRIGLVTDPVQDGSGNPIDIGSPKSIRVELQGFEEFMDDRPPNALEPSVMERPGNFSHTVIFSSLYEQSATSFIGVNENVEFAVETMENPTRVVVYVRDAG